MTTYNINFIGPDPFYCPSLITCIDIPRGAKQVIKMGQKNGFWAIKRI